MLLYIFITKYESGGMFWRSLFNRILICALLGNVVVALLVTAQGAIGANWGMLAALAPLPFLLLGFKIYCARTFDDAIHYYQKGKTINDSEHAAGTEQKKKKGDRVGVRFGHPVLYKPLMTPMVAAKSQHLLKTIYSGRTSLDDNATVAGYSDVYMDSMEHGQPGRPTGGNALAPFEIVNESQLDFEHWKNNPEFRSEHGGDGEVFGHAQDIIRPGTPGSMTTVARSGTWQTDASRSRSESREPGYDRGRSESRDSDRTKVAGGETEYPRGYHMTPSALREHSPAGSDYSVDGFRGRQQQGQMHKESREGLVASAARMGRSPPPQLPTPSAPTPGGYGPIHTPGSTPGEGRDDTSYDYFKQARRNL